MLGWSRVADPGGVDSDPGPNLEERPDPDPTVKKKRIQEIKLCTHGTYIRW